jgi:hypothetical protein
MALRPDNAVATLQAEIQSLQPYAAAEKLDDLRAFTLISV